MIIGIESIKEFGIGTWVVYVSYKIYMFGSTSVDGLISGFNGLVLLIVGSTLCTVLALSFVSCLLCGLYLIFVGLNRMLVEV